MEDRYLFRGGKCGESHEVDEHTICQCVGMTENEAIEFIRRYLDSECYTDKCVNAHIIAINALEEIQQYRAIGTVEECRAAIALRDYPTAYDPDKVVEQLEAYSNADEAERLGTMPVVELADAIKIVKGGGVDAKTDS